MIWNRLQDHALNALQVRAAKRPIASTTGILDPQLKSEEMDIGDTFGVLVITTSFHRHVYSAILHIHDDAYTILPDLFDVIL